MEYLKHPFPPVFNSDSAVLILGTFPSPQSRIHEFYYSHPQNAFWRVLSRLVKENLPETPEEKKQFLLKHHIALWDVLQACEIEGASDQKIRHPVPNDFSVILQQSSIEKVFTTGKKATALYEKYCQDKTGIPAVYLPSTSPANRYWFPFDKLLEAYTILLPWISNPSPKK